MKNIESFLVIIILIIVQLYFFNSYILNSDRRVLSYSELSSYLDKTLLENWHISDNKDANSETPVYLLHHKDTKKYDMSLIQYKNVSSCS